MKRRHRQSFLSGGLIFLIGLATVLLLSHFGLAQKWEAPAFWTTVCFAAVIQLCRRRWQEADFWVQLAVIFVVHVAAMLLLFGQVIARENFPWIITLPFIWAEVVIILKIVKVQERQRSHE